MRILYISQYFPPEIGATQTRAYEMAQGLIRAGHQVTVLTEFPNHPAGVIPPAYRRKLVTREELDGIDVIRVWVRASPRKTFRSRLVFYLSFMVMAIVAGILVARGHYDAVYATSPPLFVGAAGLVLSLLRRKPLFFEVRDLWPESAQALGEVGIGLAFKASTRLEEACYRRARRIIAVTQGISKRLKERGFPAEKIEVIPNGANTDIYAPRTRDEALAGELGLGEGTFVAIYAGLLGLVHDIETILAAAEQLAEVEDIAFLIVGDGPRRSQLKKMAETKRLTKVIFRRAVPEATLAEFISLSDVGLHAQKRLAVSHMALPVKMFSYMACRRPVIAAIEGEAAELLAESQAGIVVPPEDPAALAEAIIHLKDRPEEASRLGNNGRLTVEAAYSRQHLAARLVTLLEQSLNKKG